MDQGWCIRVVDQVGVSGWWIGAVDRGGAWGAVDRLGLPVCGSRGAGSALCRVGLGDDDPSSGHKQPNCALIIKSYETAQPVRLINFLCYCTEQHIICFYLRGKSGL